MLCGSTTRTWVEGTLGRAGVCPTVAVDPRSGGQALPGVGPGAAGAAGHGASRPLGPGSPGSWTAYPEEFLANFVPTGLLQDQETHF